MVSLASSAATLAAGLVSLWFASGGVVAGPARFTHRELFTLGVPLIAMAVIGFGINSTERILLKVYYDAGAVAGVRRHLRAGARSRSIPSPTPSTWALSPKWWRASTARGRRRPRVHRPADGADGAALLPIVALLVALSHEIGMLLLPPAYHAHVGELFPIVALSACSPSNFAAFGFENMFHAHKRVRCS